MKVSLTNLRKDLFNLVDRVAQGQTLIFERNGIEFEVVIKSRRGSKAQKAGLFQRLKETPRESNLLVTLDEIENTKWDDSWNPNL